jgi:homoserine dehydrogenase
MVSPAPPLRIVVLGLGTVGREVARMLVERERVAGGRKLELVAVGVRDPARPRGVRLPASVEVIGDLQGAIDRHRPDVVVELLGGIEPARTLIVTALRAGRSVVTGNKALLAQCGAHLEGVARDASAALRFEAAVGGGIPVLRPLVEDLAADRITAVRGIVNGTSNFILTAMAHEGRSYADALADAQARGYAEADPTADVEGHDAAAKLVVLARLAFGAWLDAESIPTSAPAACGDALRGITGVTPEAISAAASLGLTIKLVAHAERLPDGRVAASVMPTAVPLASVIGATDGVTNVIEVQAEPLGTVWFRGPGAGGPATASAVVADLLALARGSGSTWDGGSGPAGGTGVSAAAADLTSSIRTWFLQAPDPSPGSEPSPARMVDAFPFARHGAAGGYRLDDVRLAQVRDRLPVPPLDPGTPIYPILED